MKGNTFILKCFIQFTCTNLDGSRKEGGNFFNLVQKEGYTQKRGGSLRKGGFQPWRKLCLHSFSIKNIFYNKMDVRLFCFDVAILKVILEYNHLKMSHALLSTLFIFTIKIFSRTKFCE